MKCARILGIGFLFLSFPVMLGGEESKTEKSKLDLTQRYLFLDTSKGSIVQKELNEAATAGYRVLCGTEEHNDSLAYTLILEKAAQPPHTYEYLVVEARAEDLNAAGARGFRLLPLTIVHGSGSFSEFSFKGVMEKAPDSTKRYEYSRLDSFRIVPLGSHTGALQTKLDNASQQGYEVVRLIDSRQEHVVFLERPLDMGGDLPTPAAEKPQLDPSMRYRLLATTKTSTMQKEVDQAAAAGYRVLVGSAAKEILMIAAKVAAPAEPYQYVFLATTKTSTLEKELNQAGAKGFRLLPSTTIAIAKRLPRFLGGGDEAYQTELGMVMEKVPGSNTRHQYLLLSTARASTMRKELAQASQQGFSVIGMLTSYDDVLFVILEKAV
jgi:hypothetical protein